jgi:hypothetical protein
VTGQSWSEVAGEGGSAKGGGLPRRTRKATSPMSASLQGPRSSRCASNGGDAKGGRAFAADKQ